MIATLSTAGSTRIRSFRIEDGLDENDWAGFARQTAAQGGRIQIVGDDNFVTNPTFIARGIAEKAANAVLIKLNQIGTVTETIAGHRALPRGRMGLRHLASLRRDRGYLHRRLHRRDGRRPDQDRIGLPQRAHRQIQPAARNRGGAGQDGEIRSRRSRRRGREGHDKSRVEFSFIPNGRPGSDNKGRRGRAQGCSIRP